MNGYPREWFSETPNEHLVCCICSEVFNDPQSCTNGHNFCKTCILKAMEEKHECPGCRTLLNETILRPNTLARNMILDLTVTCPHKNECNWTGKLSERTTHEADCLEVLVTCPLSNWELCSPECIGVIRRGDLQNHVCGGTVETSLQLICELSDRLMDCKEKLKNYEDAEAETVGYITRAEKDGVIYCGQILSNGDKHGYGTLFFEHEVVYRGTFVNDEMNGDSCFLLDSNGSEYNGQMQGDMYRGTGKIVYENGDIYEGDWEDDLRCGQGCLTSTHGDFYEGEWQDNERCGKGDLTLSNGDVYRGDFCEDKMHGEGTMTFADGSVYEGDFLYGHPHGKGKRTQIDGSFIEGEFELGKQQKGVGCLTMSNGDTYKGDLAKGVAHGHGVMKYADGSTYDGDFVDGKMHGQGVMKFADGVVYEGTFVKGFMKGKGVLKYTDGSSFRGSNIDHNKSHNGRGVYTLANGDVVEGKFVNGVVDGPFTNTSLDKRIFRGINVNGKANGKGTIHASDGSLMYDGEFKNGLKHGSGVGITYTAEGKRVQTYDGQWECEVVNGKGVLTGPDDDKYQYSGSFVNGKRHGHGEQKYSSGDIYIGEWQNDQQHGSGLITWQDGSNFKGKFADGHRISGKLTEADGTVWKGTLANKKFQGLVTVTYENGDVYEGTVVDSFRQGPGKLTLTNGDVFSGEFKDDKMHGEGQLKRKGKRKLESVEWVDGVLQE